MHVQSDNIAHRTWEALALGAIPIVLHSTLDRTFAGLPVLLVNDYKDLTVPMLQMHYERFISQASQWDFSRLTPGYWAGLVLHAVETGSSEVVQRQHPIPARYQGRFVTHDYSGKAG